MVTPLLLVVRRDRQHRPALRLDSIPAIFGVTQNPFLVFAANAFALLGLRPLYFLIDGPAAAAGLPGLGLAVILAFIGVKLVIHALHTNELPFINGGEHVTALPEISTPVSLAVIVGTLLITTVASLAKDRRDRSAARSASTV